MKGSTTGVRGPVMVAGRGGEGWAVLWGGEGVGDT